MNHTTLDMRAAAEAAGISIAELRRNMRADNFPWPTIRASQPYWYADEISRWKVAQPVTRNARTSALAVA